MSTATLTSKGQITIPVEVRNDLKVDAGDRVEFVLIAPGRYEFVAATNEVTSLKGMFGPAKKAVSIEDMNAAIARRGATARNTR
ncbi:MAG: AbrB/MazE/SpoVT family DNA-binding domain-containing protein [Rhodoferax sp.]|nr:AbrB/MazE/SpoVT family DNA-binding domain-containing protein [Rhodoferax sp.]MCF8211883.1 AbrB/MazE/SpoVT family DNA-binding domain-containing protein [Rhodoferax sp.]